MRRAGACLSASVHTHTPQDSNTSMTSISSTDRVMQLLIAVLDITPEEIHERLQVLYSI
jgi:hypothetical protein